MSILSTINFIIGHPLNSKNKANSIIRFVKWQIGSRLVQGATVYDWINGSKFLVSTGETGLTGNIYTGLHEFSDMGFLLHYLRNEDLFVDIGANAGSYTILACSAVGARGIAFEPVPSTYKRLVDNMHLNHLDKQVQCINKGIGAQKGIINFTTDSDTTNRVTKFDKNYADTVSIEVMSLDNALQNKFPSLVKIDVEGYETPVLEGAHVTLKKQSLKAVIMELNGSGVHYGYDESNLVALMFDHGFRTYSYNPLNRSLINIESKNSNLGNTLFIRDKDFVAERLQNSPKVSVHRNQF